MGVTIYINDRNERVRVHEDDCRRIRQGSSNYNGYYKYFDCYEDAWSYIENNYDDYDCDDCSYCNPENESCYDDDYYDDYDY